MTGTNCAMKVPQVFRGSSLREPVFQILRTLLSLFFDMAAAASYGRWRAVMNQFVRCC